MLDINYIREKPDEVKKSVSARGFEGGLVEKVIKLDDERRKLIVRIETLRAERNKVSQEQTSQSKIKGKEIREELKKLEPELKKAEEKYLKALYKLPNLLAPDVPKGKDESDNKVLREWGKPKKLDFKVKDHMELGLALGLIDTETSAKVSGARFNYLKREAVLLQFALIQFTIQALTDKKVVGQIAKSVGNPFDTPFIPIIPPVIAKAEVMKKMDRFDPIEDRYYLEKDDALLIGSAEHTLGPIYMDEILTEKNLPIRYLGYSTSFRREAGTYGKDTKGIMRRHQFDKLEMETFTTSEQGEKEQELMTAIQEYLMKKLEIPYQVVIMCTGDIGKPDYRQVDINAWMPGQGKYIETHTSDYMTDFQARRLNIRYKGKGNKKEFVHMNDATAFAMGRTIIAILENYQQKDGSIIVPEVLRKWAGKDKITVPK